MTDSARDTNQHGFYREVFTKLLNLNPTLAEEIQARPVTTDEKITAIEAALAKEKS
jgi:hypothetical protein